MTAPSMEKPEPGATPVPQRPFHRRYLKEILMVTAGVLVSTLCIMIALAARPQPQPADRGGCNGVSLGDTELQRQPSTAGSFFDTSDPFGHVCNLTDGSVDRTDGWAPDGVLYVRKDGVFLLNGAIQLQPRALGGNTLHVVFDRKSRTFDVQLPAPILFGQLAQQYPDDAFAFGVSNDHAFPGMSYPSWKPQFGVANQGDYPQSQFRLHPAPGYQLSDYLLHGFMVRDTLQTPGSVRYAYAESIHFDPKLSASPQRLTIDEYTSTSPTPIADDEFHRPIVKLTVLSSGTVQACFGHNTDLSKLYHRRTNTGPAGADNREVIATLAPAC